MAGPFAEQSAILEELDDCGRVRALLRRIASISPGSGSSAGVRDRIAPTYQRIAARTACDRLRDDQRHEKDDHDDILGGQVAISTAAGNVLPLL